MVSPGESQTAMTLSTAMRTVTPVADVTVGHRIMNGTEIVTVTGVANPHAGYVTFTTRDRWGCVGTMSIRSGGVVECPRVWG